jgi:DnaJ domain
MSTKTSYICGVCACGRTGPTGTCSECGGDLVLTAAAGFVVEVPAGAMPCLRCGSTLLPLVFRGWSRLIGFVYWTRESRSSAYLCRGCARHQTAISLLHNSVLGWWSVPSFLFYGWRSLYINWRAVWTVPRSLDQWGAINVVEFQEGIKRERDAAFNREVDEEILERSPLRFLTLSQQKLVLSASSLYELLGMHPTASTEELRAAYRARCKEVHPDLSRAGVGDAEAMIRLNNAWEILRAEPLRAAYDWLVGYGPPMEVAA